MNASLAFSMTGRRKKTKKYVILSIPEPRGERNDRRSEESAGMGKDVENAQPLSFD
jgi:hypothetical protein